MSGESECDGVLVHAMGFGGILAAPGSTERHRGGVSWCQMWVRWDFGTCDRVWGIFGTPGCTRDYILMPQEISTTGGTKIQQHRRDKKNHRRVKKQHRKWDKKKSNTTGGTRTNTTGGTKKISNTGGTKKNHRRDNGAKKQHRRRDKNQHHRRDKKINNTGSAKKNHRRGKKNDTAGEKKESNTTGGTKIINTTDRTKPTDTPCLYLLAYIRKAFIFLQFLLSDVVQKAVTLVCWFRMMKDRCAGGCLTTIMVIE